MIQVCDLGGAGSSESLWAPGSSVQQVVLLVPEACRWVAPCAAVFDAHVAVHLAHTLSAAKIAHLVALGWCLGFVLVGAEPILSAGCVEVGIGGSKVAVPIASYDRNGSLVLGNAVSLFPVNVTVGVGVFASLRRGVGGGEGGRVAVQRHIHGEPARPLDTWLGSRGCKLRVEFAL